MVRENFDWKSFILCQRNIVPGFGIVLSKDAYETIDVSAGPGIVPTLI